MERLVEAGGPASGRRATPTEIDAAVRHILTWMKLTQWWRPRHSANYRWSRSTLYLTQGWDFDDRCAVWVRAMCADSTSNRRSDDFEVTETQYHELKRRIQMFGDDGGLGLQDVPK